MRNLFVIYSAILSFILLISCTKEIDFSGTMTNPMIVINSYITPDSVISVHISESRFFLNDSSYFKYPNNADVAVWVNGSLKEKLKYNQNGFYRGTYQPVVGDSVKLIVNVPGKNEVTTKTYINPQPETISIDSTEVKTGERFQVYSSGYSMNNSPVIYRYDTIARVVGKNINFKLTFHDNPDQVNYYRLVVDTKYIFKVTNTVSGLHTDSIIDYYNSMVELKDPVFGSATPDLLSLVNGPGSNFYGCFSDELFNGKTYPLTFTLNDDVYYYYPKYSASNKVPDSKEVYIYLQSISKDYYLYLNSRLSSGNVDPFFSEPTQIYNNIKGGIGILGSYTSCKAYKLVIK